MTSAGSNNPSTPRAVLLSALMATVVAGVINVIIALAAVALGANPAAPGMGLPAVLTITLLGSLLGAVGWAVVRRVSKKPLRILKVLIPIVFLVLLVPAIGLTITASSPNFVIAGGALILMHFATLGVILPVYRRFIPLVAQ